MQTQYEMQKIRKHKQKLLKKYLSNNDKEKSSFSKPNGFFVKDIDDKQISDLQNDRSQSQSSQQQPVNKRIRIASSDQQNDDNQALKIKLMKQKQKLNNPENQKLNLLSNSKLKRKFKKAFGIQDDEQLNDFIKQMSIQGMNIKEIKKLLKSKKVELNIEMKQQDQKTKKEKKKQKKQKKKLKKQKKQSKQNVKFQNMLSESSSSDIQVPDHARTIYRNKDGTIKIETEGEIKEKKKKQILDRLANWQKGMKPQDSDKQDDQDLAYAKNSVWDDPLKLWNEQNIIKPFQCKYPGPANRFNIKPGHRWDGVIRGNGFENRLIQQQNIKKANQARQHKQYLKNL